MSKKSTTPQIGISEETAQVLKDHSEEVRSTVQDTSNQLDHDRSYLDQILVNSGTTKLQLEALLKNLADFRKVFKQVAKDSIHEEVAKSVEIALNKIRLENPDKVVIIYKSFWSSLAFWKK